MTQVKCSMYKVMNNDQLDVIGNNLHLIGKFSIDLLVA